MIKVQSYLLVHIETCSSTVEEHSIQRGHDLCKSVIVVVVVLAHGVWGSSAAFVSCSITFGLIYALPINKHHWTEGLL